MSSSGTPPASPWAALRPQFVPFALDSQGRWGTAAVLELRRWAKAAVAHHGTGGLSGAAARSAVLRRWRVRVSCAAARGLAQMLLAALRPSPAQGAPAAEGEPGAVAAEPLHLSLLF